jgi:hypothetical protein
MRHRLKMLKEVAVDLLPLSLMLVVPLIAVIVYHFDGMPGDLNGLNALANRAPVTAEWVSPDGKQVVFGTAKGDRKLIELSEYDLKTMTPEDRVVGIGQKYEVRTYFVSKWGMSHRLRRL